MQLYELHFFMFDLGKSHKDRKEEFTLRYILITYLLICTFSLSATEQQSEEKHHEDPTKVITKFGIGYSDDLTFSGSIAIDQIRKINGNINTDASEWRLGGSWLFDFGILNFSVGRSEYNDGGHKETYSVGTFLPLSALGVNTGDWMVFPMAGINHTKIDLIIEEEPESLDDLVMMQNTNNGGYFGAMAVRPLTPFISVMAFAGGGLGSDDYRNVWTGAGASYKLNDNQALRLFGFYANDNYGNTTKVNLSYSYEFK